MRASKDVIVRTLRTPNLTVATCNIVQRVGIRSPSVGSKSSIPKWGIKCGG